MIEEMESVIDVLEGLTEEGSVPRNVKDKIKNTVQILKTDGEVKICVNKALHELDEVADDPNLETYTRTQIWNVVSVLEKFS